MSPEVPAGAAKPEGEGQASDRLLARYSRPDRQGRASFGRKGPGASALFGHRAQDSTAHRGARREDDQRSRGPHRGEPRRADWGLGGGQFVHGRGGAAIQLVDEGGGKRPAGAVELKSLLLAFPRFIKDHAVATQPLRCSAFQPSIGIGSNLGCSPAFLTKSSPPFRPAVSRSHPKMFPRKCSPRPVTQGAAHFKAHLRRDRVKE